MASPHQSGDRRRPRMIDAGALIRGLGFSVLLAVSLGILLGIVSAVSPWDGSLLTLKILNYLVLAAGAFYASKRAQRLGWLHGGLVGVLYVLAVGWAVAPDAALEQVTAAVWLQQALLGFAAGALGGVFGIIF